VGDAKTAIYDHSPVGRLLPRIRGVGADRADRAGRDDRHDPVTREDLAGVQAMPGA